MTARLNVKVDPIDRDVKLLIQNTLSDEAQSKFFAEFATELAEKTKEANEEILGHPIKPKVWVDGVQGGDEFHVKPHGVIVYEFPIVSDLLQYIAVSLQQHSPVGAKHDEHPGLYKKTHTLFADGIEVEVNARIPEATEYLFVNTQPYARKIEKGESNQASSGVFEVTANEARKRFSNIARVEFVDYVGIFGVMAQSKHAKHGAHTTHKHNTAKNRFPAIRVTVKI
jgi:hypothetical protein